MKYKVYYRKNPTFMPEPNLVLEKVLDGTEYAFIRDCTADDLEDLFMAMQGENWSPNGEARELILASGCHHTSMSVGDVAVDTYGTGFQVDIMGWKEVPKQGADGGHHE